MSTKAIIIAIICGIFGIGGLGWYVYDNGYDNGVSYVNAQVAAERLQWQKKINELQINSDSKIANITAQHNNTVKQLNDQIQHLKDHPKIITKYIDKQIPCTITKGFVTIHDRAVNNIPLNTMLPDDLDVNEKTSLTLQDVSNTVVSNYYNCNICIERLNALQSVIKQYIERQQQAIEK